MNKFSFFMLLSLSLMLISTFSEPAHAKPACSNLFKKKEGDGDKAPTTKQDKNCASGEAYPSGWKTCKAKADCLLIDGNCASNPIHKNFSDDAIKWFQPCKSRVCEKKTAFKSVDCLKNICTGQ